jgi:hypothetical protein
MQAHMNLREDFPEMFTTPGIDLDYFFRVKLISVYSPEEIEQRDKNGNYRRVLIQDLSKSQLKANLEIKDYDVGYDGGFVIGFKILDPKLLRTVKEI